MKWYFGVNEKGTFGGTGLHAKVAVLSAQHVGNLQPHLLYSGKRNEFTLWAERQGVEVIDVSPTFLNEMTAAAEQSRYSLDFVGHWLRSNIPLIEETDPFVLYTDCDVIFLQRPDFTTIKPDFLASAPEFKPDNWNYFNSGVMIMNIENLRSDYSAFEQCIIEGMRAPNSMGFLDQIAYNEFYRYRWDRLNPILNWKPYWGLNPDAKILHFHGPKIDSIRSIVDGSWPWLSDHGRQIGSLLTGNFASYIEYIQSIINIPGFASIEGGDFFRDTLDRLVAFSKLELAHPVDLAFTSFCMFPEA